MRQDDVNDWQQAKDSLCDNSARIKFTPSLHLTGTFAKSGRMRPSFTGGFQHQSPWNTSFPVQKNKKGDSGTPTAYMVIPESPFVQTDNFHTNIPLLFRPCGYY